MKTGHMGWDPENEQRCQKIAAATGVWQNILQANF
jgi:hypothetical protein